MRLPPPWRLLLGEAHSPAVTPATCWDVAYGIPSRQQISSPYCSFFLGGFGISLSDSAADLGHLDDLHRATCGRSER